MWCRDAAAQRPQDGKSNVKQLLFEAHLLTAGLRRAAVLWEEYCKTMLDDAASQWFANKVLIVFAKKILDQVFGAG